MSPNFVSVSCKRMNDYSMKLKSYEKEEDSSFLHSGTESHCYFGVMCNREKVEQRVLLGKLDLWDLKGLLERLVLRACGGSPVLW